LRLMGKKLLISLAMEGKLQAEGLQSMEGDGDLLTAMARELVNRQGVGEGAAAVWKALQAQRDDHAPAAEAVQSAGSESASDTVAIDEISDEPWVWASQPSRPMEQLSLF